MSLENDDPNNEKGNVVVDRKKKAKVEVESSDEEMDVNNEELLAEVFFFLNLFLHFVFICFF